MNTANLEKAVQLVTAIGVILTGIGEIIKQYNVAMKKLEDKEKKESK